MPSTDLSGKMLIMIVGPAGIGKSTVMHATTNLDERFSYVRSFTTRPNRDGPRTTYRHITEDEAAAIQQCGSAVTYFKHPTTGYVYGTEPQSYSAKYNLLDTLSATVERYRLLPFERTLTISLTADPDAWEAWLLARYPEPSPERKKRLQEAVQSIEWSLAQTASHSWLMNQPGDPEAAAHALISIATESVSSTTQPAQARALYDKAVRLLSYE